MLPLTAGNSSVPVYCKRGTHLANGVRLALRPPMPSRLHTAGTSAFQPPVSSGQYLAYSLLVTRIWCKRIWFVLVHDSTPGQGHLPWGLDFFLPVCNDICTWENIYGIKLPNGLWHITYADKACYLTLLIHVMLISFLYIHINLKRQFLFKIISCEHI